MATTLRLSCWSGPSFASGLCMRLISGCASAFIVSMVSHQLYPWHLSVVAGVLCEGQGVFLQALEGERGEVTGLYARIFADPRHKDLELIHCEGITERRYGEWSMARVSLSDVDPQTKIVWPEFDPYSASGVAVMARIDELIAQGRVIDAPLSPGNG
jgi:hypothetical protein